MACCGNSNDPVTPMANRSLVVPAGDVVLLRYSGIRGGYSPYIGSVGAYMFGTQRREQYVRQADVQRLLDWREGGKPVFEVVPPPVTEAEETPEPEPVVEPEPEVLPMVEPVEPTVAPVAAPRAATGVKKRKAK